MLNDEPGIRLNDFDAKILPSESRIFMVCVPNSTPLNVAMPYAFVVAYFGSERSSTDRSETGKPSSSTISILTLAPGV